MTQYRLALIGSTGFVGANSGSPVTGLEIIPPPSGFPTFRRSFNIYRNALGAIGCDYNMQAERPAAGVTYYASPAGVGSGTTIGAPCTLAQAYAKSDVGTIKLVPDGTNTLAEFDATQVVNAAKIKKNLNIIGRPGVYLTGCVKPSTLTWTNTSGNIYQITQANAQMFFDTDENYLTSWKDFAIYQQMATPTTGTAASLTAAGQWATDGTTVWVWALGNKNLTVSTNRDMMRVGIQGNFNGISLGQDAIGVYVEGVEFWACGWSLAGQSIGQIDNGAGDCPNAAMLFYDCKFKYAPTVSYRPKSIGFVAAQNCIASSNIGDGLGYESAVGAGGLKTHGLEIDCYSHHNGVALGYQGGRTNTNGSTSHNGTIVVRVNTKSDSTWGPNFADVSGAQSWNVGCIGNNGLVDPTVAQSQNVGFQVNGSGGAAPGSMWLDSCDADNNYYTFNVNGGSSMYIRRFGRGNNKHDLLIDPAAGSTIQRY